ncbi:MAG: ATP-binding protein [Gammaproteobacteria bacterium]|nr:ATP-binding protein [Gammaproteobacteria bacterium]
MIIGRSYEQKQLQRILQSKEAEFVAVYGRRRVGKTYLIREFFNTLDCVFFRSSGIHKGTLKKQLEKFNAEIELAFYEGRKGAKLAPFTNWHEAFQALTDAIALFAPQKKIVVFLDEMPWMATPKSGLLEALDYYWNRFWSENKRFKLIICGSAASWIIDNVLHNTGGLHNRVTLRLPLEPFNLCDTKAYLHYKHIHYSDEQILTLYLCMGGIPYYLNFVTKGLSAIQNINAICFTKKGTLYDEFDMLFASLFKKHEIHETIITLLAGKREGVSRADIEAHLQLKGGRLTGRLKELEEAGFIVAFKSWKKERGTYYKIIDEYTLFYLTWIAPRATTRVSQQIDEQYWDVLSTTPAWRAWSGFAFEAVCFKHIHQIKKALSIPSGTEISSWRDVGGQIDLIFDRPDNVVNLCEIKYCSAPFIIDKSYAEKLQTRGQLYCKTTKTKKDVFYSMIVSGGLKTNMYSEALVASVAILKDLFKSS